MIVATSHSTYEIRLSEGRFRRLAGPHTDSRPPIGAWRHFEQVGPVVVGQPIRFFSLGESIGSLKRFGLWSTSPVTDIVDEGSADEHVSRTFVAQVRAS
jgi:hypothetical protein